MPDSDEHGQFNLFLGQRVAEALNIWSVTKLWISGDTDIALLRLSPYSAGANDYKFRHLTLSVLPPRIGTQVHGFGYADSSAEKEGPKQIVVAHRPRTTHGEVVELFPAYRDPIKMPFPCFRTNARFDGGMSGGPLFNEDGHLCGLICSTYPPFNEDEDHASFGVMLWPTMGMPIDMNRVGYPPDARYALFDLVKDNMLVVFDKDKLTVGELPASGGARVELLVPNARLQEQIGR